MKFFIKTNYVGRYRRLAFWSPLYFSIQPFAIAIICENNTKYFGISSDVKVSDVPDLDSRHLPGQHLWKRQAIIRDEIELFLKTQAATEKIELYGFSCSSEFVAFSSLWGGVDKMPEKELPNSIIDVSQTFMELMDFVSDNYFDDLGLSDNSGEYDLATKMEMFLTHPDCPIHSGPTSPLTDVVWTKYFSEFIDGEKAKIILNNNIEEDE